MELETAIDGIMKYRNQVHEENLWGNPNGLSEAMLKLATYNAYIADYLAPLHKKATDTAHKLYLIHAPDGVTNAEQVARGGSTEEREAYENAQNIYKSTSNLISVMQSRLKIIQTQERQEE